MVNLYYRRLAGTWEECYLVKWLTSVTIRSNSQGNRYRGSKKNGYSYIRQNNCLVLVIAPIFWKNILTCSPWMKIKNVWNKKPQQDEANVQSECNKGLRRSHLLSIQLHFQESLRLAWMKELRFLIGRVFNSCFAVLSILYFCPDYSLHMN